MLSCIKETQKVSSKKEKSLLLPRDVSGELQAQKVTGEERPAEPDLEG